MISDHRPLSIKWDFVNFKGGFSFKFNQACLEDESFNLLVRKFFKDAHRDEGMLTMEYLMVSLHQIKFKVREWENFCK